VNQPHKPVLTDAEFIQATISILQGELNANAPDMAQRCVDEMKYAVWYLEQRIAEGKAPLTLERGITLCATPGCLRYATHFWNRQPHCRYHGRGKPGKG